MKFSRRYSPRHGRVVDVQEALACPLCGGPVYDARLHFAEVEHEAPETRTLRGATDGRGPWELDGISIERREARCPICGEWIRCGGVGQSSPWTDPRFVTHVMGHAKTAWFTWEGEPV